MKFYPDPSLIVSAYVEEPRSREAAAFLNRIHPGTLLTSWWTYTEITSALGVKARTGTITPAARLAVLAAIRAALRESATTVTPVAEDFQAASDMMERVGVALRGGDALHLAVSRRNDAIVWTLDRRMAEAGEALGLGTRLLA